jgi:CRISPR-associated endonuclease/helicase Cas3
MVACLDGGVRDMDGFEKIFHTLTGNRPLRWQTRLHGLFMQGESHIPEALDLPTGLGKTSVMAVWLAAKIMGARLPNRLVYVVDRRTVVDQATGEADKLKTRAETAGLLPDLPISTLRGQNLDNRRWMEDPAAPAIVIGTVDMIGSRLLFQGYGVSTGMRPFQAGLLGADTLLVLDEAHLCPPFQKLLKQIEAVDGWKPKERDGVRVPPFRLMSLSATGEQDANAFTLQSEDYNDDFVKQRVGASKRLTILEADVGSKLEGQLADVALALAEEHGGRIAVFCTSREVAQKVVERLSDKKAKRPEGSVVLLAGARRVKERESARTELMRAGFLSANEKEADLPILSDPTFLVATAAGEVGVDLDADHAVMDLVAAERMIQRLGRVNRKGGKDRLAQVQVIDFAPLKEPKDDAKKDEKKKWAVEIARREAIRLPLKKLPTREDGGFDASPGALRTLREDHPKLLKDASTPEPLYPALDRPTLDAWAMTSLKSHPGRPEVAPWLRGWVEEEEPEVTLVWRKFLPVRVQGGSASAKDVANFFDAAPPHLTEMLETETDRVLKWLPDRAKKVVDANAQASCATDPDNLAPLIDQKIVAFALPRSGEVPQSFTLDDLMKAGEPKGGKDDLKRRISECTLILDARLGGLSRQGLFTPSEETPVSTPETDAPPEGAAKPWGQVVGFRVRSIAPDADCPDADWQKPHVFDSHHDGEGNPLRQLRVEKHKGVASTEEDRALTPKNPQLLKDHQEWADCKARRLVKALELPGEIGAAIVLAALLHDEGKKAQVWQRAFSAKRDGIYAKTTGPFKREVLGGYRHEFGSLAHVEWNEDFRGLSNDVKDLVLHLVVAHHGRARPVIETDGCEDAPPSVLAARTRDVALRFARLQRRYGPWGLAWLEALVRAADRQASRDLDEGKKVDG